jgi:glycosyltransferase involved in cell wall biosynthesis
MLAVSLVTLGSPAQLTGGYLYHLRMAEAAPAHDAEVRFVSFPALGFPLPALWATSVRRRLRDADVVAVDSIAAAFLAPGLRSTASPPLVAVVHQVPGGIDHGAVRAHLQAPFDRFVYRRARRVIAASETLAGELVAGGLEPARLTVVAPGCDVGVPPPSALRPDLRQGRSAAFVSVGNWVARKGILDLVDAFARLPPEAATLHLVGRVDVEPRYAARVRRRLQAPELTGRVVVHGPVPRPRVASLLSGADAFVLPSVREPYGTVYGEALAAGLPVVGWRAGNLPFLAEDGREGVVLEPGDIAGLAQALHRLAVDETYRDRLRRGAQARGRSLPTWEESARRFFAVLREAAG